MADHSAPPSASSADEADLLRALRAGREDAYDRLVRENGSRLLAVARRILGNDDDARDAVQDAFIAAFRNLDRFHGGSRLSTWLHRIVVNAALMKLRTRRRKPEQSLDPLLPSFRDDGHHVEQFVSWEDRADVAMERDETRRLVRDRIQQLPEAYRIVLLLRDIEGLTTEEAATALGTTANAVKIRLHRARQALRSLLDQAFLENQL